MAKVGGRSTSLNSINVRSIINVIIVLMIISAIFEISTCEARKSMRRSRSRKIYSPRVISSSSSKRKENHNNTAAAQILRTSHFDQEYFLGHKITLICLARGNPVPRIIWTKESIEIMNHRNLQISEWKLNDTDIKSKLEIDPARQMDSGTYACVASNKFAVDQRHIKVDFAMKKVASSVENS